jgi:2-polyprenyl-6-hydroxyphenyl methylase/3-demethylubiquinone-9 3-methyltransferase
MIKSMKRSNQQEKPNMKKLHGNEYVERFNLEQSPLRLDRLNSLIALSKDMLVCDFGCGNGMLMEYLCPRVAEYQGVDFSENFIVSAKARKQSLGFSNATFFCEDINQFCASRECQFDAAFAMDFSEHVHDDDWIRILVSIRSTLKPGGILYLHTPNARFLIEIMKEREFLLRQFPEHVAVRDAEHNVALLVQAGFVSVNVSELPHYNILKLLHPLSFIPIVGKYFEARLFIQAVA